MDFKSMMLNEARHKNVLRVDILVTFPKSEDSVQYLFIHRDHYLMPSH